MDIDAYRKDANDLIDHARERNASHEHPESLKLAAAASKILALCDEIDRLRAGTVEVTLSPTAEDPFEPEPEAAEPEAEAPKRKRRKS